MKFLPLLLKSLLRHKLRTSFTFLAIFLVFLLYGVLAAVEKAFSGGVDIAGAERLRMIHKVSVVQALPLRYVESIRSTEGVEAASYVLWFGGIYHDPRKFFPQLAVDPESYLEVYPEYLLADEERQAWLRTRTGAIAGRALAERYGWEIGDRIPLQATIYPRQDGNPIWELTLEGIYDGVDASTDEMQLFFHYKYLEEGSERARGDVRWFVIRIADPSEAAAVAERLDRRFANSSAETKTSTEKAFLQAFANQVGNTGAMLAAVSSVALLVILFVVANTLMQSVRERRRELGILKALGFSDRLVLGLVLGEASLLCGVAGCLGLWVSFELTGSGSFSGVVAARGVQSFFYLTPQDVVTGVALVGVLALSSAAFPALGALRLRIVDALGSS